MVYVTRLIVAIVSVGIFTTSAMAVGIRLDATVNPNDLLGIAEYSIGIRSDSPYGANYFSVYFEDDIFASVGTPTFISGAVGFDLSFDGKYVIGDGYGLGSGLILSGESLRFSVEYTLTDPDAYDFGTDPDNIPPLWSWDENASEPWNQAVEAKHIIGTVSFDGKSYDISDASGGGSTSVPEPASIVLIGSGLIGLGLLRKARSK